MLAAVVGCSATANAAFVGDLGTLEPGDSGFLYSYEHWGTFEDDYTFQVSETADLSSSTASFDFFFLLHISDLSVSIYEGPVASPVSLLSSGAGSFVSLLVSGLTAGTDYFIRIAGVSDGLLGGKYKTHYSVVSSVPVPPALALFVSGLVGIVGVAKLRRRRRS